MSLINLIEKSVTMNGNGRSKAGETHFRASEVGYLCARKHALKVLYPSMSEAIPTIASVLPLAIGTGVHYAFQNELMSNVLVGEWVCKGCGQVHGAGRFINKPVSCGLSKYSVIDGSKGLCDSSEFEYQEKRFVSDDGLISGHPDGFVRDHDGSLILIELKTIGLGPHKTLDKGPKEEHIKQAQIYMHYFGCSKCYILYIIKHERGLKALREFEISYSEELVGDLVGYMKKAAEFKKGDPLPERTCSSLKCTKAVYCSHAKRCFQIA